LLKLVSVLVPAVAVYFAISQPGIGGLLHKVRHSGGVANLEPQTFVYSHDPVVVYVKDFISPKEASYLVNVA